MIAPAAVFQLVRADFLERVRRHSFLITLGFTIYAAYMFLPPMHSKYATLDLGGHRGVYNSAWVGTLVSMLGVTFLSLAGFYLVKNAVERDRQTGVGAILAATPMPGHVYLVGKFLSNFVVLATMVAVLAVASGIMQLILGEDTHVRPLALLTPFVLVTLPVMGLVAGLAVTFEVLPLWGGLGNIVYFFLWITTLSLSAAKGHGAASEAVCVSNLVRQMQAACAAAYPDYVGGGSYSMGFNIKNGTWDPKTFVWDGLHWTPDMLAWRAFWMAVPFALTLVAALFFDRFDTQRASIGGRVRSMRWGRKAPVSPSPEDAQDPVPAFSDPPARLTGARALTRLTERAGHSRFGALVIAELRIALKGVSRWWYFVVLVLTVLSLFVPLTGVRKFVTPFALIWPVMRWSPMGTREASHRTDALLFSSPRPLLRLLSAQWLAGWVIALMVSAGALARFTITGEWGSLAALLAGVVFVPSMALACGTWSGGTKLFEVLYLLLWYMGPMNQFPPIDFVGTTQPASGLGAPAAFAVVAAVLTSLAVLGRRRQLAR